MKGKSALSSVDGNSHRTNAKLKTLEAVSSNWPQATREREREKERERETAILIQQENQKSNR